jgi:hypothetical protein
VSRVAIHALSLFSALFFLISEVSAEDNLSSLIISKDNFRLYSPLLRIPEINLLKMDKLSIPTKGNALIALSLGNSQVPLLAVDTLNDLSNKSGHKESIELKIEFVLFKSSKILEGKLSYLSSADRYSSSYILSFPGSEEKHLGPYIFYIENNQNKVSKLSILSPVTKKCREIPLVSISDPILFSGLSLEDIFPNMLINEAVTFTGITRTAMLIPAYSLENSLTGPTIAVGQGKREYQLHNVHLVKKENNSPFTRRPISLQHRDSHTGLIHQEQHFLDKGKMRGIVLYSWISLADNTYLPKEITYYEERGESEFDLVSKISVVGLSRTNITMENYKQDFERSCDSK